MDHLVGLVEHHGGRVRQVQGAPLDVVDETAGRAHDDLRPALEPVELDLVVRAAVDGERLDVLVLAQQLDLPGHLQRQLARGAEDERLHGLEPGVHAREQRQPEGGGLAGPGRGLPDEVARRPQQDGQRLGLDVGGRDVAQFLDGAGQGLAEGQLVERGHERVYHAQLRAARR
jgi:hypothetical protein